jgi:adenylate kinase family enzyme
MRRVLILGSPGSGKSTFARKLGAITGLPVIHLDQLFWEPGWVQAPMEVFLPRLRDALAQDEWIIDGNFASTLDLRLPRADRIILFERSRLACVARVGRRVATSHGVVRQDMAAGCPEKLDLAFLKYVWSFPATLWPQTLAAIERHGAMARTTTLRSDKETGAFLAQLQVRAQRS